MAPTIDRRLRTLWKWAEFRQYLENPMYAFLDELLSGFASTLEAEGSIVHAYPQHRLIPHKIARNQAINTIKDATPDFSITVSPTSLGPESFAALFEVKRLCHPNRLYSRHPTIATPHMIFWVNNRSMSIACDNFRKHIEQIVLQAYCGFTCSNQQSICHIFVCGFYFWLIEFRRPANVQVSTSHTPSTFTKALLGQLMPKSSLNVIFSAADIFEYVSLPLKFSPEWKHALQMACDSVNITQKSE
ncbi:hypothetical protein BDN72DRAFT_879073, partial [Pluteus cervinus]